MLWIKAFHVIFMVTWFAGLFYLPRLFVYHCQAQSAVEHTRFCTMERRLFAIMSIGMAGTLGFGLWLWLKAWGMPGPAWLQLKFGLAMALVGYHHWLLALMKRFARGENRNSERFYRWINEIPALFLMVMVILAIVKPF